MDTAGHVEALLEVYGCKVADVSEKACKRLTLFETSRIISLYNYTNNINHTKKNAKDINHNSNVNDDNDYDSGDGNLDSFSYYQLL